jgi:hypothetical protein
MGASLALLRACSVAALTGVEGTEGVGEGKVAEKEGKEEDERGTTAHAQRNCLIIPLIPGG